MPDLDPDPGVLADDDDELDGCDIDMSEDSTTDEEVELFPLFAEALDPTNPKTVEEAEAEWRELLGEPTS